MLESEAERIEQELDYEPDVQEPGESNLGPFYCECGAEEGCCEACKCGCHVVPCLCDVDPENEAAGDAVMAAERAYLVEAES